MEPIGKYFKKDGEEVLVHKCRSCGFVRANRVAGDDSFLLVEQLSKITPPV
jgi:predicted Zn-ribbon and HTH transcriptional regulator